MSAQNSQPWQGIPMDDMALAEAHAKSIMQSDYEGWVAYVEGNPIYEARTRPPGRYPVLESMKEYDLEYRPEGRRTKEWKDLPHARVHRVELYMREPVFESPLVLRLDRVHADIRFLQMKEGAVSVTSSIHPREGDETGPRRSPVMAYRIGYWDPHRPQAKLWRISREGHEVYGVVRNPWAPRPKGWGLNPDAFGLEESH